jgi:hypothetical protein
MRSIAIALSSVALAASNAGAEISVTATPAGVTVDTGQPDVLVVVITAPGPSGLGGEDTAPGPLQSREAPRSGGLVIAPFTAMFIENSGFRAWTGGLALGVPLFHHLRGVVSASIGKLDVGEAGEYFVSRTIFAPLRAGVEGHLGALCLQVGAQVLGYLESARPMRTTGRLAGPYAAVKLDVPIGPHVTFGAEAGLFKVLGEEPVKACESAFSCTGHGGWLGLHFGWSP